MNEKGGGRFLAVLFWLFIFLFFRIESWLCSIPMWITLILHFTIDLPIWWFWATLGVWLATGLIRWLFICFGRWGANSETPEKENKNPYSSHTRF